MSGDRDIWTEREEIDIKLGYVKYLDLCKEKSSTSIQRDHLR